MRNALGRIAASTVHPHAAADGEPEAVASEQKAAAPVEETTVQILDLPVTRAPRKARQASAKETEQILGSVLEALPQPKQPGQGRRGSRRASSAGTVTPPAES